MLRTINMGELRWVHVVEPSSRDVAELQATFGLHQVIADELTSPSDRDKVEHHDGYLFLVYHLPIYSVSERSSRRAEIDILITKTSIATVTYERLEPLVEFERTFDRQLKLDAETTADLLYHLLKHVHEFSFRQLKHVEKKIQSVGAELFTTQNRHTLEEISYIKRDLLEFSIIAVSERNALTSLVSTASEFWGTQYEIYFSDALGDFLKADHLLDNLKATINSYSETVSHLFEFKTSEIVRRFSILGFLTFPLLLYSTIALQPQVADSFIRHPNDFWIIFGLITVLVVLVAAFFRKKRWL